jgi:hypothetical protein
MTRTIRLWMDLGRDGLEHEHCSVASHDGPEVISASLATAFIKNVEPQLGLIVRKRSAQVVDNKKGSDTVQHSESALDSNIAYVEQIVQSATPGTADVMMKTNNGEIWSDFDIKLSASGKAPVVEDTRSKNGKYKVHLDRAMYGSINGGGPEMQFVTYNGSILIHKK